MFLEIMQQYEESLLPFCPYPPITDRAAWSQLDHDWQEKTVSLGEQWLNYSWHSFSALEFMDFYYTGIRNNYENIFFEKRTTLCALVLAECVEGKRRFIKDIINGIFSICEESAWNVPAHNSYRRDEEQCILPHLSNPVLDLFACETGALLGTTLYLLKAELDEISPFIGKRIRYELERRIYIPYLNRHFWWMGDGKSSMNNWTVWCTQNVLLSSLLVDEDSIRKSEVLQKACESTDYFLEDYGDDGCCSEGAEYYRHAGLCLFQILDICNRVTGGSFLKLTRDEKIRNIASYIYKVHIDDKYYINFADCSPIAGRAGAREYLFAKMTHQQDMMDFAKKDFNLGLSEKLLLEDDYNLYHRLQNGFMVSELRSEVNQLPIAPPDVFFPSIGVFAVRDEHLFLAVKAGNNGDSHNHNDTGNFIVYKDGKPLVIDVGVGLYTKKTFSPSRYEIWTMQSAYHNLPTFDGIMQMAGKNYEATNVSCNMDECSISMELVSAYPECGITSYQRSAQLKKKEAILIKDYFKFADHKEPEILLSLMTWGRPIIKCNVPGDTLIEVDKSFDNNSRLVGYVKVKGALLQTVEEILLDDARLVRSWGKSVYRILLKPYEEEISMEIK